MIACQLHGSISELGVVDLSSILKQNFPNVPDDIVNDLSRDQNYACRKRAAVMAGSVDESLNTRKSRGNVSC